MAARKNSSPQSCSNRKESRRGSGVDRPPAMPTRRPAMSSESEKPTKKDPGIKALETQISHLEKAMGNTGDPKFHVFSQRPPNRSQIIPFGIPEIDSASNVGGHPKGTVIELFGMEQSGKSFISLKMIASYQSLGLRAALVDVEHAFMPDWAATNGVDLDRLIYGEDFAHGEEALAYVKGACENETADIVVIDSTAGLLPKSEVEGGLMKDYMATHARMLSFAVPHIVDAAAKHGTTVVFINQIRTKPGVMYGNPEETPGGKALKFYSHVRLDVRRIGVERTKSGVTEGGKEKQEATGIRSRVRFVKNRVGKPFGEGEFNIFFSSDLASPTVRLVQLALRLKALPNRKTVDGQKHYIWGSGKDAEDTGCTSVTDLADWLSLNEHVVEMLDMVEERNSKATKEYAVTIPPEVMALRAEPQQQETAEKPAGSAPEQGTGAEDDSPPKDG